MLPQNLNPKQLEAVESPKGPLLIAAGAGSGKTKTLTSRLLYFLGEGADPEEILAITFTNKAAREMADRVYKLISSKVDKSSVDKLTNLQTYKLPFIGTFHAFGAKILRDEGWHLNRNRRFTIFDNDDSLRLMRQIIKRLDIPKGEFGAALALYKSSRMKDNLLTPEDIKTGHEKIDLLTQKTFHEYERELENQNAFDFDDLIEKPVRILEAHPEILKNYQKKYKFILIDEFQDINTAQYRLMRLIAQKHRNVSAVGDDAQAIYAFRGADFKNFLNFERDWEGAKMVLLEENYRSSGNIIKAASSIIANNINQKPKSLWTKNEPGELLRVVEHPDQESEAEFVAEEITNNKSHTTNQGTNTGTVAVLYRTNAQSRPIEQSLIERNTPYQIFGGIRFYERKEIKDMVACLRYASNPKDEISLDRIKQNFLKKPYLALKDGLKNTGGLPPNEVIGYILKTSNYLEHLAANFPNFQERLENIQSLIEFASTYEDLGLFIEKMTLLEPHDAPQKAKVKVRGKTLAAVNLMTIHNAKGLEFDKVYVVGANEGLIPHQMSLKEDGGIEEERRLMYVAMTRAKSELSFHFYNLGSRFLYEIPPELIEFKSLTDENTAGLEDDEDRYISYD